MKRTPASLGALLFASSLAFAETRTGRLLDANCATRQTTAEFFKALESNDKVAAQQRAQLNELLVQCDLAKFARVVPAREDCLHLVDAARKFVEAKLDNPTADVNGAPQLLEGKTESLKSASG